MLINPVFTREVTIAPRREWTCVLRSVCVGLLLLFVVAAISSAPPLLAEVPALVISEETTRITGPLTADGQINFFKALEQWASPPELATDDNGFRVFVRLFGSDSVTRDDEFLRLQIYEKLALDPNIPPTLVLPPAPFRVIEGHFRSLGRNIPTDLRQQWNTGGPWTLEQFPMLSDWIKDVDVPLDAIADAVRKPVFFMPLLQIQESIQSGTDQMRTIRNTNTLLTWLTSNLTRAYSARASYRIGQGDIDGAMNDKLTIHRLVRLNSQKHSLQVRRISMNNEASAMEIPLGANPKHPLTEAQIRRLLDGIDALPLRAPLRDTYEWERFWGLAYVHDVTQSVSDLFDVGILRFFKLPDNFDKTAPFNWNIVYRRVNEFYDALQEPSPQAKWHSLMDRFAQAFAEERDLRTPDDQAELIADACFLYFTFMLEPGNGGGSVDWRIECAENMQRLAFAILLYQIEHGQLPDENWATHIKKYLGEKPERFFSCPANLAPEGQTTYAMVQYGNELPDNLNTILLVELKEPVPFEQAVISVEDVLARKGGSLRFGGGMNAAFRSGAVRLLWATFPAEDLKRFLGQE